VKFLCISFTFIEYWDKHADVQLVQWIQAKTGAEQAVDDEAGGYKSEEEEEDDEVEENREVLDASDSDTEFGIRNKFAVLSGD
jgi:hypothetical protein